MTDYLLTLHLMSLTTSRKQLTHCSWKVPSYK